MKVDEFIEEYEKLDNDTKMSYVESIINTEYVPYATKVGDCKRIIQSTSYTSTDPKMFCMNSPSRYMLFNLQLIIRYTSLEIDLDGQAMLKAYDNLDKVDALRNIIATIPAREVVNYNRIMDMMLKDFQMNEHSLVGFLDTKLASLGIIGEALDKILSEEISV